MSSKSKIFNYSTYLSVIDNFINLVSLVNSQKDYDNNILYNKLYGSLKRVYNGDTVVTSNGLSISGKEKKLLKTNSVVIMTSLCNELLNIEKDLCLTTKYRLLNDLLVFMYLYINFDSATFIDLRKFVSKKVPKILLEKDVFEELLNVELQKHITNIDAILNEDNLEMCIDNGKIAYKTINRNSGE